MKNIFLFLLISMLVLTFTQAFAATKTWAGGAGTGLNWTTPANWGGTAPVAADDIVFNTAGTITFSTMPTGTIAYNSLTISQGTITLAGSSSLTMTLGGNSGTDFTVASGATLVINANVNIILASSETASIAGTLTTSVGTTTINGTITNSGTVTGTATTLIFTSGSTYEHARDGGAIPTAGWNVNSTCLVTGIKTTKLTSAIPSNIGNLTWNCTGQNYGSETAITGPLTVNGNLTIMSTGSATNKSAQFRVSTGNIAVNGNFIMTKSPGSNSTLVVSGQSSKNLVVGGNVDLASGDSLILNLDGWPADGWLHVAGNLTNAGIITVKGTSTASGITFTGTGTQIFTSSGTLDGVFSDTVKSGATLTINGASAIPISKFTVNGTTTNNSSALTVSTTLEGTSTLTNTGVLNIGGTSSITTLTNSGTVAITGSGAISTTLANFTNTGTLNLNGSGTIAGITNNAAGIVNLSSSGTITSFNNATSTSTLNISAATVPTITTLTATAAGNMVNYTGAAQTVKVTPYSNLTLSGSAAKTIGAITVNGILSMEGTATASAAPTYGAAATLQYNTATARTAGVEWITPFVATGGVIIANTGTITLNAAKVFNASIPLTIQSGATLATNGYALTLGGNFTCAGNFNAGAGTFTLNGSGSQTVGGATYNNLTLSGGGAKSLGGAATVNGVLNFGAANNLSLGANTLTLGGTVSGAAAGQCIVTDGAGVVSRSIATTGNFLFPIAPIAGKYNPVSITNNDVSAQTYTAAVEVGENPSTIYNAYGCNRTWRLTKSGTSDADVVFTWYDADKNGSCVGSLCDVYSSEGGGAWIEKGGSGTTGTGTPYTTAVTTNVMSNWTVANSGAFPVEMTSFTAAAQKMSAQLKWNTATEVNNYGFEIERRAIASNVWAKVGFVSGNGTSNIAHNYTYADNNLSAGTYAYRLKQIDNDGAFKYSASTEVAIAGVPTELKLFGNYPNPFNPSTKVQFTVPENGNVRLRVYNIIGQEVATLFNGAAEAGNLYTVDFDASRMASGLYFSVLEFGNQRITHKMMMTR